MFTIIQSEILNVRTLYRIGFEVTTYGNKIFNNFFSVIEIIEMISLQFFPPGELFSPKIVLLIHFFSFFFSLILYIYQRTMCAMRNPAQIKVLRLAKKHAENQPTKQRLPIMFVDLVLSPVVSIICTCKSAFSKSFSHIFRFGSIVHFRVVSFYAP